MACPRVERADALLPGKTDLEATEHDGTVPGVARGKHLLFFFAAAHSVL